MVSQYSYGITTREACDAVIEIVKNPPPLSDSILKSIENNPSLNLWQKRKLKRELRIHAKSSK